MQLPSVGNLALTAKNSRLSNRPFEKKLQIYGESDSFNQEKEIITFATVKNKKRSIWDKPATTCKPTTGRLAGLDGRTPNYQLATTCLTLKLGTGR